MGKRATLSEPLAFLFFFRGALVLRMYECEQIPYSWRECRWREKERACKLCRDGRCVLCTHASHTVESAPKAVATRHHQKITAAGSRLACGNRAGHRDTCCVFTGRGEREEDGKLIRDLLLFVDNGDVERIFSSYSRLSSSTRKMTRRARRDTRSGP